MVKKPPCYKPATVAPCEITQSQRPTDFVIHQLPVQYLLQTIAQDFKTDAAVDALQEASEAYVEGLLKTPSCVHPFCPCSNFACQRHPASTAHMCRACLRIHWSGKHSILKIKKSSLHPVNGSSGCQFSAPCPPRDQKVPKYMIVNGKQGTEIRYWQFSRLHLYVNF